MAVWRWLCLGTTVYTCELSTTQWWRVWRPIPCLYNGFRQEILQVSQWWSLTTIVSEDDYGCHYELAIGRHSNGSSCLVSKSHTILCVIFVVATVAVEERDVIILEGLANDVATICLELKNAPMLERNVTGSAVNTTFIPSISRSTALLMLQLNNVYIADFLVMNWTREA